MSDVSLSQLDNNELLQGANDMLNPGISIDSENVRAALVEKMTGILDEASRQLTGYLGGREIGFSVMVASTADHMPDFLDAGEPVVHYTAWLDKDREKPYSMIIPQSFAGNLASMLLEGEPPRGPDELVENHLAVLGKFFGVISSSMPVDFCTDDESHSDSYEIKSELAVVHDPGVIPVSDDSRNFAVKWNCRIEGIGESNVYQIIGPHMAEALVGERIPEFELERKVIDYALRMGKKALKGKYLRDFYENDLTVSEKQELMAEDFREKMNCSSKRTMKKRLTARIKEMVDMDTIESREHTPPDEDISSLSSLVHTFRYIIALRFEDDLVPASEIYEHLRESWDPDNYLGREGYLLLGKREIARVILKKGDRGLFLEVLESMLPGDKEELRRLLLETPITISVEIARSELLLEDLQNLGKGSIIEYDRLAGEPVDILMEEHDRIIAKGEVVVIDENLGVRVTDILDEILDGQTLPHHNPGEGIHDMPVMTVKCIVGRTVLKLGDLAGIGEASLIELDRLAGSPVDVVLADDIVLKGEVVVIDENFGVRITEDDGKTCDLELPADAPPPAMDEKEEDPYDELTNRELIKKIKKTHKDDPELVAVVLQRLSQGPSRVAFLMGTLGEDLAAEIVERLDEETVLELTRRFTAGETTVSEEDARQALKEFLHFRDRLKEAVKIEHGYIRTVLAKGLGKEKAKNILKKVTLPVRPKPMAFLQHVHYLNLLNFIQGEHPQTIALILAYLDPQKSAQILSGLNHQIQADVARRIAIMDRTSPDVLREVERVLERKLSTLASEDFPQAGGIESIVEVMKNVDRGTEKIIIEALAEEDPYLAMEIKKRIFDFSDIVYLDDRSMQKVMRELESQVIVHALKGAGEEVQEKFSRNMSERAYALLKEDMEIIGEIQLKYVERAQARILAVIRELEESEDIIIVRPGEEDLIE